MSSNHAAPAEHSTVLTQPSHDTAHDQQAAPTHAGEGLPPLHGGPLVFLTLATALSTFMEVLDTTIANVAVPTIAGSMGVSAREGTSIISSYSLAAAIAVPLTGWTDFKASVPPPLTDPQKTPAAVAW